MQQYQDEKYVGNRKGLKYAERKLMLDKTFDLEKLVLQKVY
jgi:hypothetical protein